MDCRSLITRTPALAACLTTVAVSLVLSDAASAQFVPGTGTRVQLDDFEDDTWSWTPNWPKSSKENDETIRHPLGRSGNGMWFESPKRGQPDVVKRIATPAGGLADSTGSLYLRSRDTGVPNQPEYKMNQDDFIMAAKPMALSNSPSTVVRVYLPEWSQWEQRTGVSFGMRLGLQGIQEKEEKVTRRLLFRKVTSTKMVRKMEPYYPGFFIQFNSKTDRAYKEDHAVFVIRAQTSGHDQIGPKITQTGWWTLGMSVTPDARVHYYAKPGVADLTSRDLIFSSLPYGIPGEHFNTIFFNVCSSDNGRTWSTPWIIDDPAIYYMGRVASRF